jgi:DNA replicative helicase MCM subunit Mcm2 (Cdc46/Mcm family)
MESEDVDLEYSEAKVKDIFVEFLKGYKDERNNELKYRIQISQLPAKGTKSVIVDYPDLQRYDTDLATSLVKEPDLFLKSFDAAAVETLNVENPVYADKIIKELHVRLRELSDRISLRNVTKEQLNTLILVAGMVTRTSEIRPLAVNAAFRCSNRHITFIEQTSAGSILKRPVKCETEGCGETRNFELDEKKTEFIDFQVIKIQEMPEELPPGQLPQSFDVNMTGDLVNVARPGDRIVLTGIVKAESESIGGVSKKLFNTRIEANFTEQIGKRPEEREVSREEEEQIKSIAAMPAAYDRLIQSVAPAIFGHELHKEAALLLMVGSPQKSLPDGSTLRGDINILLVGDPGCLVFDERIVLGDGTIAKIGQMGRQHLQQISTQVLTGEGVGKRALATRFHAYRRQRVMEIITESGKSLKGTPNHPALARKRGFGARENEWRRLDEFKIGDKVIVTSGFPCSKTALVSTGFKSIERKSKNGQSFKGRFPLLVDEDLASLLGYMLRDGWVKKTSGRLGFVVSDIDKDIFPQLVGLAEKLFGLKVDVLSKVGPGRRVLLHHGLIHSKEVAANLAFLQTKRVPDLVLASGDKVLSAFLRWLFEADGTVFPSKRGAGCVALKSVEIELLRDVQLLLLRFGIHSRIVGNALTIHRGAEIAKFAKAIGFASERKSKCLAEMLAASHRERRVLVQRVERIVKIIEHEPQDVFDIEVPNGHRFIANGIISHNTAKSELLKYVARVAPRGLFTSGRGSTAAGLTAAVVKEKNGMMMLEAGATVLADLGVACLHPDDKILFDDKIISIGELAREVRFERAASRGEEIGVGDLRGSVHSFVPESSNIQVHSSTLMRRKRFQGNLKVLRFKSGNEIKLTPDHMLLDGDTLLWRRTDSFAVDQYVVAPRKLPSITQGIKLWDILPDNISLGLSDSELGEIKAELEKIVKKPNTPLGLKATPPKISRTIPLGELREILRLVGKEDQWKHKLLSSGRTSARVSELTAELAYLLGFLYGDGYFLVRTNGSLQISLTQSAVQSEYFSRFEQYWNACFSKPFKLGRPHVVTSRFRGKAVKSVQQTACVSNWILYYVYQFVTSDNLSRITSLKDDVLAGFIAGLMDSDGSSRKTCSNNGVEHANWDITFTISDDNRANRNLALALRRFGVLALVHDTRRNAFHVTITNRRDCSLLKLALQPYSIKMGKAMNLGAQETSGHSELLPLGVCGFAIAEAYKNLPRQQLTDSGVWSQVYEFSKMKSMVHSTQIVKLLEKRGSSLTAESRLKLESLTSVPYFLDKIESISEEEYSGYVYDLHVPGPHNFVAEGIIVENCIDEFDKMRDEDRSALHEVMEQQSYHPSVEIALCDGARVRIGEYVEKLMRERSGQIVPVKDCEILPLKDGPELYSCDISGASVRRIRIDRVSRHRAPSKLVEIKYSNGRKIIVTPDHPVFVYKDRSIKTISASEVSNRDFAPAPRIVPNSSAPVALASPGTRNKQKQKNSLAPEALTLELSRVLGFLIAEGRSYTGSSDEIVFSNSNSAILAEVKTLFGRLFGIRPSIAIDEGVTTQRYISKTLFFWFRENFPEILEPAKKKRAPRKVLGSSVSVIREFLAASFLGDGSLERTSIGYRTESPGLAEDYQDLLHKLGIFSRIVHDTSNDSFKVPIMGDCIPAFVDLVVQKHDRRFASLEQLKKTSEYLAANDTLPPQVAEEIASLMKAVGIKHSHHSHEHNQYRFGVNRCAAENLLSRIERRISAFEEFALSDKTSLKAVRAEIGISQKKLESIANMKKGRISYLEQRGYQKEGERLLAHLRSCVATYASQMRTEAERMRGLLKYRFLRITDVKTLANKGSLRTDWVYDVTVEPTNTFISKGLILHNTASVAKGGIIATLNARTSILAAANPVDGKYDPYKNILDNVALPIPLLSRFDLIFIIRDDPDPAQDETVAKHILDMRSKSSFPQAPPIEFELLKKYIIYAKKLDPEFTEEASNRLSTYYIQLRRQASPDQISVTPRWLEGMIRLSIARARLLLHSRVIEDDALHAIKLVERMLTTVAVDQATKKVDVGVLYNRPLSEKGLREAALDVFKRLSGESKQPVEDKAFYQEMEKENKFSREQIEKVFQDMWKSGVIFEVRAHFFKKA